MNIDHQDNSTENARSFMYRFYVYQQERFPFLTHGLLIASFSFSAISYSRICRRAAGFVDLKTYLVGIITTITLFFLLRIFDEFKDKEDDALYRKYLPVPRGLISLKELKYCAIAAAILQIVVNLVFFPKMLILYFVTILYLLLMGKEFFISEWLRKNQVAYVLSHMLIIPLVDTYASGLDWLLAGVAAPVGLLFFFGVSYMNGIVLEIGRKIRKPGLEETGVLTYSAMYGAYRATWYWMGSLLVTLILSMAAAAFAGYGAIAYIVLGIWFAGCILPAVLFLKYKTQKLSKGIEIASGIWTLGMYLTLGGIPMLEKLIWG